MSHQHHTELSQNPELVKLFNAIAKLTWSELLIVQANLSEHIFLCYQYAQTQKELAQSVSEGR